MKLHLPKGLKQAVLKSMVLGALLPLIGINAYGYRFEAPVGGGFYAGDFTLSFIVEDTTTPSNDIIGVYYGGLGGTYSHTINGFVLNQGDDGNITLSLSRADGISSTTLTNDVTLSTVQNSSIFKDSAGNAYNIQKGVSYTIEYLGGSNGNAAADLYMNGEKVASFTGGSHNMNDSVSGMMNTAYNSSYVPSLLTWGVTEEDKAQLNYTTTGAWVVDGIEGKIALLKGAEVEFGDDASLYKTVSMGESIFLDTIKVKDDYIFLNTGNTDIDATGITVTTGKTLTLASEEGANTAKLNTTLNGGNLEVTGSWIARKDVKVDSLTFGENGRLTVENNATLDLTAIQFNNSDPNTTVYGIVNKLNSHVDTADDSFIKLATPSGTTDADKNNRELRLAGATLTLAQNFRFTQALEINGGSKTASELRVCSGSTLILEKGVEVSSYTNLNINGGTLETTTLTLGHRTEGNDNSYYGKLTMSSGSIKADSIYFRNQQGNEVNITGGEVEFTSQNAISYNDKNTSGNRVSINISNATLKASLVDWKLDGKTTAQSQVSNVIIDANNTKKITLNNVALSGTITNNKWLELGGATKATGEVVLAGTGGETTVYGNYEHLKAEGNAESVLNVKSGAVINNLSAKSGVVNISGTHNDLELFDASVNGVSTATVYLEGKAELQANTIWAGANASIYLKEDAKLHVGNGVSFVGKSDATPAEIKSNGNHQYVLSGEKKSSETNTHRADDFTIKNANVYVNSTDTENGVTIGNRIQNSGIINDGIATATLVNGWNNLNSIQALKGDINLQWIDSRMQTSALESLIIEANRAVGAHTTDASLTSLQNNASLTVQGIATIGENASFYGNLIIASGTTLTMADTFNLYGDLTLNGGVTLDGSMLTAIQDLAYGESLAIFDKVSALVFSAVENPTMTLDTEALARVDASLYFTNLEEGIYFITHVDQQVIITSNIPEPTTATLSLLALAALAARRRRR